MNHFFWDTVGQIIEAQCRNDQFAVAVTCLLVVIIYDSNHRAAA